MDDNTKGPAERSAEELAWDDEFRNQPSSLTGNIRGMARVASRVPGALMEVPGAIIPSETRRHARAAVRESFLAVRSLFTALGDNIEGMLADPSPANQATVKGPAGTWGTGRASLDTGTSSSKVKRISITDEIEEEGKVPSDEPGDMP